MYHYSALNCINDPCRLLNGSDKDGNEEAATAALISSARKGQKNGTTIDKNLYSLIHWYAAIASWLYFEGHLHPYNNDGYEVSNELSSSVEVIHDDQIPANGESQEARSNDVTSEEESPSVPFYSLVRTSEIALKVAFNRLLSQTYMIVFWKMRTVQIFYMEGRCISNPGCILWYSLRVYQSNRKCSLWGLC